MNAGRLASSFLVARSRRWNSKLRRPWPKGGNESGAREYGGMAGGPTTRSSLALDMLILTGARAGTLSQARGLLRSLVSAAALVLAVAIGACASGTDDGGGAGPGTTGSGGGSVIPTGGAGSG